MASSEQALVERVRHGDIAAFDELSARYREAVRRHALGMLRDAHSADDVTQEVFLRLWTHAEQWNGTGSLKAWLLRIATNLTLNMLRSTRRRRQEPLEVEPERGDEEDDNTPPPG